MSPVRRSTRAKKKAVTFIEEHKIKESSGRKKKKKNQQVDNDEDSVKSDESMEVEEQEAGNESSSESEQEDEESPPASRKRKSPSSSRKSRSPATKARTVTPKTKPPAVGKVGQNGPTRRQALTALKGLAKKTFNDEESNLPLALLTCIDESKKATNKKSFYTAGLQKITHHLIEDYVKDSNETSIKLLNLIFTSVGAMSYWTPVLRIDDLQEDHWEDALEAVADEMAENSADKVLLTAAPSSKLGNQEYRKIMEEFWYQLGLTAANHTDALEEEQRFVLEMFQTQLVELAEVKIPDVRFLLSLANYQMGRAMLDRSAELLGKVETAERQLKVAKRSKSTTKVKALSSQIEAWNKSIQDLEDLVGELITSLFAKRYRDSNEHIRKLSLQSLADFGKSRPDLFVNSTYMKYFFWTLSDKSATVRQSAVEGLLAPFQSKVDTSTMKAVIGKSLERLVDCTRDIDTGVQDTAMELLLHLLNSDFLEDLDVDEELWSQVNSRAVEERASPKFRRNALYFVLGQLEAFDKGPFRSEREAAEQIEDISKWLAHTFLHDDEMPLEEVSYHLTDLVVASLREMKEHQSLVCNWPAMLRALQNDDRKKSGDQRIDIVKQRVMIRMLVAAAKHEVTDVASDLSIVDPKLQEAQAAAQDSLHTEKKKKSKQNSSAHEDLTLALLRTLPDLLQSYKSESAVLQSLTELPQYFMTRVLGISARTKEFKSLMKSVSSVFLDSTDDITLSNTCGAMVALSKGSHARSSEALLTLKEVATSLYEKLLALVKEKEDIRNQDMKDGKDTNVIDTDTAMNLCLRRFALLSKRWPIFDLVDDGKPKDEELEAISRAVSDYLVAELKAREIVVHREDESENETVEIPEIWTDDSTPVECHAVVSSSVSEGLDVLLSMLSWRFKEEIEKDNVEYDNDNLDNHVVVRIRKRLIQIILCCFEHFLDQREDDLFSDEHRQFSTDVNAHGWRIYGDLRSLFPHKCHESESPLLAKVAVLQDKIMSGAGMRFILDQTYQFEENEEGTAEKHNAIKALLYPLARGLSLNWETGYRMEAGRLFRYASGSGKECHDLVLTLIRSFKKIDPLRLLESMMTCLRVEWDGWSHRYPQEPDDRPTEAEMELYEQQRADHAEEFHDILKLASAFTSSLGVGKLKNKDLAKSMGIFFKNGIMISFAEESDETPGCRLSFLRILSKFLPLAKRDKAIMKIITNTLDDEESKLRQHRDFADAFEDDLEALVYFRTAANLDPIVVEEEDTVNATAHIGSNQDSSRIRMSSGSSVSTIRSKSSAHSSGLESIEEGEEEEQSEDEEEATPSPSKRRRTAASQRSAMSQHSSRSARSVASSVVSSIIQSDIDGPSDSESDGSST